MKSNSDGTIARFKARLVAQGFTQEYGIDYNETFAPVVRMSTIRAVLALACENGWELEQMDVKTAFLNAKLEETIYMKLPKGFEKTDNNGNPLVAKLNNALYGLK